MAKKKKLTKVELEKLAVVLTKLEDNTFAEMGYQNRSGGFVDAKHFDYDDDTIDVELKFGIQDGEEDSVNTEQYEIDRHTMEIIND